MSIIQKWKIYCLSARHCRTLRKTCVAYFTRKKELRNARSVHLECYCYVILSRYPKNVDAITSRQLDTHFSMHQPGLLWRRCGSINPARLMGDRHDRRSRIQPVGLRSTKPVAYTAKTSRPTLQKTTCVCSGFRGKQPKVRGTLLAAFAKGSGGAKAISLVS